MHVALVSTASMYGVLPSLIDADTFLKFVNVAVAILMSSHRSVVALL